MVLTIVFGVIGFGIMVFVHELGHFIAAKRVGIGVETFSLGWGKKIVGFDYKGTNYRISMLPFGGYCKLKGEDPYSAQEQREDGTFFAAPPWKRIVVSAAGPLANDDGSPARGHSSHRLFSHIGRVADNDPRVRGRGS